MLPPHSEHFASTSMSAVVHTWHPTSFMRDLYLFCIWQIPATHSCSLPHGLSLAVSLHSQNSAPSSN